MKLYNSVPVPIDSSVSFLSVSQVALTILSENEEKLIKCSDDGEAIQLLTKYLQGIHNDEGESPIAREYENAEKVR